MGSALLIIQINFLSKTFIKKKCIINDSWFIVKKVISIFVCSGHLGFMLISEFTFIIPIKQTWNNSKR